ncbi:Hypothetical protein A7982_01720 [Minicystis rosea]|nr:Hypothetical protein A7982_01720 [Minicystis rosea]
MATIALPRVPEAGNQLEDYVAGLFQAAGYYVEKNVRQRDVVDVLELDAVATSYDGPLPEAVLAEAKGGRWGFPDIFKVAGWMAYLGIDRGGFFVKEPPGAGARDVERMARTVAALGVELVDLGDFQNPGGILGARGFRPLRDPLLLDVFRLAFAVERALLDGVRAVRRAHEDRRGAQEVLAYHDLINDHVFFLKDVDERLRRLYAAYRSHPKLSLTLARESAGEPFAEASEGPVPEGAVRLLVEAMYEGKHPLLQGSFYVEHRARLAILKATIDLACLDEAGQLPAQALAALPATFLEGLRRVRARPAFRRYALLWQVFLWGFGGFYRADRAREELALLGAQTGMTAAEVGEGLSAFDDLFPLARGSWIVPVRGTGLRVVKMVPAALRGVGAVQRLRRAGARNYDGLGLGTLGRRNLITWHNALVRRLAESAEKKAAQ